MKQKSRTLIFSIFLAILTIVSLFLFFYFDNKVGKTENKQIVLSYDGKDYVYNRDLKFCLITGLDSYSQYSSNSYMNDQLCDFLLLLVMDDQDNTITPIHINRDSMVSYNMLGVKGDIVSTSYGQIALSHTYGDGGLKSLVNVKDAVSDLFKGIHIDYYVSVTMDAIPLINDELGYVTVYMDEDYTDLDPSFKKGEYVTLKKEQSLIFVRDRYNAFEKTNLARMERQRVYIKALFEKLSLEEYDSLKIMESISDYIVSNANLSDLSVLANKMKTYELKEFVTIDGESKINTNVEYYLDENSLNNAIIQCLEVVD